MLCKFEGEKFGDCMATNSPMFSPTNVIHHTVISPLAAFIAYSICQIITEIPHIYIRDQICKTGSYTCIPFCDFEEA